MLTEHETHILNEAERYVNELHDGNMAFFVLRDLPLTERLGWMPLCWVLYTGNGTDSEARWLIATLRAETPTANIEGETWPDMVPNPDAN